MARKKLLGRDAVVSVKVSRLHPSDVVAGLYPNPLPDQRVEGLIVTGRGEHTHRGRSKDVVWMKHPDHVNQVFWAAKTMTVVRREGPVNDLEVVNSQPAVEAADNAANNDEDERTPIDTAVFAAGNVAEDIAFVRGQGLEVDDDNEPAPENIPTADAPAPVDANAGLYEGQKWGWEGIDQRRIHSDTDPSAKFKDEWSPEKKTWLEIWMKLFPFQWLTTVLLGMTNKSLATQGEAEVTLGELLRYLGLWMLMATVGGFSRDDFWSDSVHDEEDKPCPYNFKKYMTQRRFRLITEHLRFTDVTPPTYKDKFWQVRQMIKEWNKNMNAVFVASWVICLDESMSIWFNRWTCPGWVFCPRKPHPFGNEYHTMCCAICGLMLFIELVEGKDHPKELPEKFSEYGKTVGLLLRMLENYFGSGRYVVLDSGFCVLQGLKWLRKKGLFACALIKKRRYWPWMVPGDAMERHFQDKEVGDTDAIEGVLDGVKYTIWGMKEPNYIMRMMATGGALLADETCKMTTRVFNGVTKTFQYLKPFDWHFRYRHAVDDHNNLRHATPSLEGTWLTLRWEIRVFTFLLAITEVNVYLTLKSWHFVGDKASELPSILEFRRKLAWLFIKNPHLQEEENGTNGVEVPFLPPMWSTFDHTIETAPAHAKAYHNRQWIKTATSPYQQYACKWPGCKKQTRSHCSCTPGYWLCPNHVLKHAVEEGIKSASSH